MSHRASEHSPLAAVFAPAGVALGARERDFFRAADPLGFILFARNCESPDQIRRLCDDLRATLGRNCPVLIDQEGGRVRRYKGSDWPQPGPARNFGEAIQAENKAGAERLEAAMRALAEALVASGIDVNCAPVADLAAPGMSDAIGDRAYSDDPAIVARACERVCRAFLDSGVTPVVKHLPGHGRAQVDPHDSLPCIDAAYDTLNMIDFAVFQQLFAQDYAQALWGMMAHAVYTAIDPERPASMSPRVIDDIVRRDMGFTGLLLSDDISMGALSAYGTPAQRAERVLAAGCDCALYCHGVIAEMEQIAAELPRISAAGLKRFGDSRS